MKKFINVFSIIIAFVVMISASVLLSGCTESLSMKEGSKAMVMAAGAYHKDHVFYDNFANTTYTFNYGMSSTRTEEYTFRVAPETQAKVTESLTSLSNISIDITMSTYNTVVGTGADAHNELYFSFNMVSHQMRRYYYVEDEFLITDSVDETTTVNYVLASKLVDNVPTYYVTMHKVVSQQGELDQVTKEYYEYSSVESYRGGYLPTYLDNINNLIDKSFFFASAESLYPLIAYEKEGSRVTMGLEMTIPQVEGGNSSIVTTSLSTTVYGNKLGFTAAKMTIDTPYVLGHSVMNASLKVNYSSNPIELPSLTDYDEVYDEIEITDIPDGIIL